MASAGTHFTSSMDQHLIDFVRRHEAIYNNQHEQYKNMEERFRLWSQAAKQLGRKPIHCKTRWRTIRDSYRKFKIKQAKSIPCSSKYSKYSYINLSFLDESILDNKEMTWNSRRSGTQIREPITADNDQTNSSDIKFDDTIEFAEVDSVDLKQEFENENSDDREDEDEEETRNSDPVDTPVQNATDFSNPTQDFFKAMASTVMTFPAELIIETKLKVCQLVAEMELRALKSETGTG